MAISEISAVFNLIAIAESSLASGLAAGADEFLSVGRSKRGHEVEVVAVM